VSEGFADVCHMYGKTLEASGQLTEAKDVYYLGVSADPEMDNARGIAQCHRRIQFLGME